MPEPPRSLDVELLVERYHAALAAAADSGVHRLQNTPGDLCSCKCGWLEDENGPDWIEHIEETVISQSVSCGSDT